MHLSSIAAACLAITAATVCGAFGQSITTPTITTPTPTARFDAASIKLNPSLSVRHVLLPPIGGRLSTRNAPLRLLIQNAYRVRTFQISGGPDWMNSAGYDLEAKAEGSPTRSQIWFMLQSLLEDRFALRVHREMRELPVYVLTAAKGGLKLPKPKEGDCTNVDGQRFGRCGDLVMGAENSLLFVRGKQVAMAELIRILSEIMERPILDKTGDAEKFDVNLEFAYDEFTAGIPNPRRQSDSIPSAEPAGLSIMTALQRQLGLKLESAKGPVEIIVIDHVERPSEN